MKVNTTRKTPAARRLAGRAGKKPNHHAARKAMDAPDKKWRHVRTLAEVTLPGFDLLCPNETPLVDRLREATKPMMVKVAPGKWAPAKPHSKLPYMTVCFWQDNGDGTFSPIPVTERLVKLDSDVALKLGFDGQYNTLRRLGEAGFVEIVKAAPGLTLLNIDSWFNHLRRCAEDPEFWDRKRKNFQTYKLVIV